MNVIVLSLLLPLSTFSNKVVLHDVPMEKVIGGKPLFADQQPTSITESSCPLGCSARGKCENDPLENKLKCLCNPGYVGTGCQQSHYQGYGLLFKGKQSVFLPPMGTTTSMTVSFWMRLALKSKKSKRKIKSKTTKASSFDLDNEFDDYSKRSSSGSTTSKTSSRRMSSPIATSRKRVTMSPPDANYENQTINSNKKISEISKAKKSIVVEDIPLAPSAPIVSSQPTKDQMLAEIDNLLSDDSDSD